MSVSINSLQSWFPHFLEKPATRQHEEKPVWQPGINRPNFCGGSMSCHRSRWLYLPEKPPGSDWHGLIKVCLTCSSSFFNVCEKTCFSTLFVFKMLWTEQFKKQMNLPMVRFELRISSVGSNRSARCAPNKANFINFSMQFVDTVCPHNVFFYM